MTQELPKFSVKEEPPGSGRYYGRWWDPDIRKRVRIPGGTFPASIDTQEKALDFARKWVVTELGERAAKAAAAPTTKTWTEVCDAFVEDVEKSIRIKGTAETEARLYGAQHGQHPTLSARPVAEHDVGLVLAWLRDFASVEIIRKGTKKKRSHSTVRNAHKVLRYVYRFAKRQGLIALNPADDEEVAAELAALKERKRPEGAIPVDNLKKLFRRLTGDVALRRLTAVYTSCGPGELHGLRVGSYRRSEDGVPYLAVREQFLFPACEYGPLKTAWRERDIPVHPCVQAALDAWVASGWEAHVGRKPEDDDPLYPDILGKPYRENEAETFRAELAAAGCSTTTGSGRDLVPYDLRHTFATMAKECGIPKEDRAHLMGHSPGDVEARHYTQVNLRPLYEQVSASCLSSSQRPHRVDGKWTDPATPRISHPAQLFTINQEKRR